MAAPVVTKASAIDSKTIEITFDQAMLQDANFSDPANYDLSPNLPAQDLITLQVVSPVIVRLSLPINMKHGQAYSVTVYGGLQNLALEAMNPAGLVQNFQGIGDEPKLLVATALDFTSIEVTFDEPINTAAAVEISNWKILSQITGKDVGISGVTPFDEGTGLFKTFTLSINTKMTDAAQHTLSVFNMVDVAGNPQSNFESIEFLGLAERPKMIGAKLDDVTGDLFVTYDTSMARVSSITLQSYIFLHTIDSAPVYYQEATISKDRKTVRIKITETKNEAPFAVRAQPTVRDDFGNSIDPTNNQITFFGNGEAPTIVRTISAGQNRIDVVFSEFMYDNEAIRDPANYTADNGLLIVKVIEVDGETVKLATTDQADSFKYTVIVN